MILGGPFGASIADLGLSRPHHPPQECFCWLLIFFRESSLARPGAVFRQFS